MSHHKSCQRSNTVLPEEFSTLSTKMKGDEPLSFVIHCSIFQPCHEAGLSREESNKVASSIMMKLFNIDTSKFNVWIEP